MARKGKEFEELVTRIEKLLIPSGAEIKSPDRIKEKVTGEFREVDVSIRYKVGSVPILITIECRDRNDEEDVTWIEQIATKKEHIGASKTIAVSSKGFSENAIRNAKLHDIEIRIISEISDEMILDWPDRLMFSIGKITCRCGPLGVVMYMDKEFDSISLDPADSDLYMKHGLNAKILIRNNEGSKWSISKIYHELVQKSNSTQVLHPGEERKIIINPKAIVFFSEDPVIPFLLEGVPGDGSVINKKLGIRFPKGEFSVNTSGGVFDIYELTVDLGVSHSITTEPKTKIVEYKNDETTIVQLAETEIVIDENRNLKVKIMQHRVL